MIETKEIEFATAGPGDIKDITKYIEDAVAESETTSGIITAFVPGSTGAITSFECEPGLVKDISEAFERLIPSDKPYHHADNWRGRKNGFSHVRSAFIGADMTIPFVKKKLALAAWQQIVFMEFDVRRRQRQLILQIIGE